MHTNPTLHKTVKKTINTHKIIMLRAQSPLECGTSIWGNQSPALPGVETLTFLADRRASIWSFLMAFCAPIVHYITISQNVHGFQWRGHHHRMLWITTAFYISNLTKTNTQHHSFYPSTRHLWNKIRDWAKQSEIIEQLKEQI